MRQRTEAKSRTYSEAKRYILLAARSCKPCGQELLKYGALVIAPHVYQTPTPSPDEQQQPLPYEHLVSVMFSRSLFPPLRPESRSQILRKRIRGEMNGIKSSEK